MKTRIIVPLFLVLVVFTYCTKQADEWIDVTPGPHLQGWTVINIPPDKAPGDVKQWSVSEGTVRCSGEGGHEWLRYDGAQFADFIFHAEWRFEKSDEPAKYNSGIYVRNSEDGTVWHQAQTGDASGGYLFGKTMKDGELVRLSLRDQMQQSPVRPAGEWNTFDITCTGSTISMVVNGVPTVQWTDMQVTSGYIGLEAEGYAIQFRNLRVKPL